jgi:hypothetical protein
LIAAVVPAISGATTAPLLLGALAEPIRHDFQLSAFEFGLILTGFFAATSVGSVLIARSASSRSPVLMISINALAIALITASLSIVTSATALAALLIIAGAFNAAVQPSAGRLIVARTRPRQLASAAGLVGAAITTSSVLAGLLALTGAGPDDWQRPFLLGGVLIAAFAAIPLLVERRVDGAPFVVQAETVVPGTGFQGPQRRALLWWTVAAGLATIAGNALATFFVTIGVKSGVSQEAAAVMLSLAGLSAIGVRVAAGFIVDAKGEPSVVPIAASMAIGACGLGLLAVGGAASFRIGGILAALGCWGWTGLVIAFLLSRFPAGASRATATVQVGIYAGAAAGPLAFAWMVSSFGLTAAALGACACSAIGAAAMLRGRAVAGRSPAAPADLAVATGG